MRKSARLERSAYTRLGPRPLAPPKLRRNHPRDMWCEAIGNSKSKLNTVIGQPRQQSDAQETHRLKDSFMDAWNHHEAIVLAASSII
jgi:hypothetical protein